MTSSCIPLIAVVLAAAAGCSASAPPPTARAASTDAAIRGAREVGAESVPNAALHLKLSQEQAAKAKTAMKSDDNVYADLMLQRAQSDAELAIALTRESTAQAQAQQTTDELARARSKK
jgi:hypothetical protein